jgi:hypothetical protein
MNNSFINNISINNNLYISSNTILSGNVSMNSTVNVNGNINLKLYHYLDNTVAKNAGIPIWGWYRNGGVVSVRLNDVPPIIYFSSSTTLSINVGTTLTDPGAFAKDYINKINDVYLISILNSSNTNFLNNNILITGTSTLIPTSSLIVGNYTATYTATDESGNITYNYRILNIH